MIYCLPRIVWHIHLKELILPYFWKEQDEVIVPKIPPKIRQVIRCLIILDLGDELFSKGIIDGGDAPFCRDQFSVFLHPDCANRQDPCQEVLIITMFIQV